jgi:hypothetical protein
MFLLKSIFIIKQEFLGKTRQNHRYQEKIDKLILVYGVAIYTIVTLLYFAFHGNNDSQRLWDLIHYVNEKIAIIHFGVFILKKTDIDHYTRLFIIIFLLINILIPLDYIIYYNFEFYIDPISFTIPLVVLLYFILFLSFLL